jgi:tetratricopeptide (TPR) repeat protein
VILHDPLSPQEHIELGISYEAQGELDAAQAEYRKASEKLPIAYLYLGNIHFQKNDLKNAIACYRRAIRDTNDPRAYNNLAWLYYTNNMALDEAEALAQAAVELAPDSPAFVDTLERIRATRRICPGREK